MANNPFPIPDPEAKAAPAVQLPTSQQAEQFCLMINAGMPSLDAIRYFLGEGDWTPAAIELVHNRWITSRPVTQAWKMIMRGSWQELDLERRIGFALDKHYSELAYYVFTHNFSTVAGADIVKLNTARSVLETKVAGMAGKMDAMTQWLDDLNKGRIKLGTPVAKLPGPTTEPGSAREAPHPPEGVGALDLN